MRWGVEMAGQTRRPPPAGLAEQFKRMNEHFGAMGLHQEGDKNLGEGALGDLRGYDNVARWAQSIRDGRVHALVAEFRAPVIWDPPKPPAGIPQYLSK